MRQDIKKLWQAEANLRQKKREVFARIDHLKRIHGKIQAKITKLERRRVKLETEEKKTKEVNSKKTKELTDEFRKAEK